MFPNWLLNWSSSEDKKIKLPVLHTIKRTRGKFRENQPFKSLECDYIPVPKNPRILTKISSTWKIICLETKSWNISVILSWLGNIKIIRRNASNEIVGEEWKQISRYNLEIKKLDLKKAYLMGSEKGRPRASSILNKSPNPWLGFPRRLRNMRGNLFWFSLSSAKPQKRRQKI